MSRQAEIIRIASQHHAQHGFPPTVREIAVEIGISHQAVHRWLLKLRTLGLISMVPGVMRSIVVKP